MCNIKNDFTMSWCSLNSGCTKDNISYRDVIEILVYLKDKSGCFSLGYFKGGEYFEVQVRVENDNYLVTFGGVFDGDYDVMSYDGGGDGFIMILGDLWPEAQDSKDFNFVKSVFKIFYKTGWVPKTMLN